jgi:hypothetical protein
MKARLVPLAFPGRDEEFDTQVNNLKTLLVDEAEILDPVVLGEPLSDCDAVVFPQVLGDAYRQLDEFIKLDMPILFITSEFGTVSMWDWEIASYLRTKGIDTIAPYNLEQTKMICRALAVKRELKASKFLVFQDNPGEGFQASIFKRFYWWEDECIQRMLAKFGITIEKKSFKEFGGAAQAIPDEEAEAVWDEWKDSLKLVGLNDRSRLSALKIYILLKRHLEADPAIKSIGINCLNESHYSDTTPCLAWNMLFEEKELIWGCEGDIVSMLTKYILYKSLRVPIMMTNLYPFLMGQAALKHERIPYFPETDDPDNHILAAHCGYLGVLPQSMSTDWEVRPKVLAIVDDNAHALNARMQAGAITLAKFKPGFESLSVIEGDITGYAQYSDSDCLNGAVLKVPDGHKLLREISSHHYLLLSGHNLPDIEMLAKIFDFKIDQL